MTENENSYVFSFYAHHKNLLGIVHGQTSKTVRKISIVDEFVQRTPRELKIPRNQIFAIPE
jgi:hypothetical protein